MVGRLVDGFNPAQETFLERRRIDPGQDARECVFARNARGQVKIPSKPTATVEDEFVDSGDRV
jgi:hypothetical protein